MREWSSYKIAEGVHGKKKIENLCLGIMERSGLSSGSVLLAGVTVQAHCQYLNWYNMTPTQIYTYIKNNIITENLGFVPEVKKKG